MRILLRGSIYSFLILTTVLLFHSWVDAIQCYTCSGRHHCADSVCEGRHCATVAHTDHPHSAPHGSTDHPRGATPRRYRTVKTCLSSLPYGAEPNRCYTNRPGPLLISDRMSFCSCSDRDFCNQDNLFGYLDYLRVQADVTCCLDKQCNQVCAGSYCVRYSDDNGLYRYDCVQGQPLLLSPLLPVTLLPMRLLQRENFCYNLRKPGIGPNHSKQLQFEEACFCASFKCNAKQYQQQLFGEPSSYRESSKQPIVKCLYGKEVVIENLTLPYDDENDQINGPFCYGQFCVLLEQDLDHPRRQVRYRWCLNTTHPQLFLSKCFRFHGEWSASSSASSTSSESLFGGSSHQILGDSSHQVHRESVCMCRETLCNWNSSASASLKLQSNEEGIKEVKDEKEGNSPPPSEAKAANGPATTPAGTQELQVLGTTLEINDKSVVKLDVVQAPVSSASPEKPQLFREQSFELICVAVTIIIVISL